MRDQSAGWNQNNETLIKPVHEAAVLEVITVSSDLQLPAGEAFSLIESNLEEEHMVTHLLRSSLFQLAKSECMLTL